MNFTQRFARLRPAPLLDLGTLPGGNSFTVPFSDFDFHGLVAGPTGHGKTRLLQRFNLEVAEKHPEACIVVISPKGAFAPNFRNECYRRGWQRRVVYIDFSERRRLAGINVLRSWGDPFLQAKIQREILTRAMGLTDLTQTPRLARYIFAGLYAAIVTRLTIREVGMLFDHAPGGLRQAVIERMPESDARRDLELLEQTAQKLGQAGAARFFEDQVGSSLNRFRMLSQNPLLQLMLGSERSLDWDELLCPGRIVVINADQGQVMDREDQRYLVTSIIADLARTCFSRPPERAVRVSLTVDEIGWFRSTVLSDILDRGREFKLSLLGSVQYLSQFIEPGTGDRQLLDSFLTDTLVKIVFGGLPPVDAELLAGLMYRHLLNPDKRQLELYTQRQIQTVGISRSHSVTENRSRSVDVSKTHVWGESTTETDSETHGTSTSVSSGRSSVTGEGLGSGNFSVTSASHALMPGGMPGVADTAETAGNSQGSSAVENSFAAEGESETETMSDIDTKGTALSRSEQEAWGETTSKGVSRGVGRSVTVSPMVQPSEPFLELSSVTLEPLDTQLQRHYAELVRQPKQHVTFVSGKEMPRAFRVANVPGPRFTEVQARALDLEMMEAHAFFQTPAEIEHDIAARHRALIRTDTHDVTVDTTIVIERRRASRRQGRADDGGDVAGVGARLPVNPPRPRLGRVAARTPVLVREA